MLKKSPQSCGDLVTFLLEFAFPDSDDGPAGLGEFPVLPFVALDVPLYLGLPEVGMGFGHWQIAPRAVMPEATVDEYRYPTSSVLHMAFLDIAVDLAVCYESVGAFFEDPRGDVSISHGSQAVLRTHSVILTYRSSNTLS